MSGGMLVVTLSLSSRPVAPAFVDLAYEGGSRSELSAISRPEVLRRLMRECLILLKLLERVAWRVIQTLLGHGELPDDGYLHRRFRACCRHSLTFHGCR